MRAIEFLIEATVTRKLNSREFAHLGSPALMELVRVYDDAGFDLRIVGGAVRDLLQGKLPKDVDLASNATPEESIAILEQAGIRVIETGIQHGTITAVVDHEPFEITTLRVDTEHTGRHATVAYTRDWAEDAKRRDLTFNAMSLSLDGTLYDYFGGLNDLRDGVARFVGSPDERIREDYLRILRYFRFQGRVSKPHFDRDTIRAIADNAAGLDIISGERIWMEMSKILAGQYVVPILRMMHQTHVDAHIGLPLNQLGQIERVKKNTDDPAILLAALLPDMMAVDRLMRRWKLSRQVCDVLAFIVEHRDEPMDEKAAKAHYVDPKRSNDLMDALLVYQGKLNLLRQLQAWAVPIFPISGKDLIDLGVPRGPEMGQMLRQLQQQWQESNYTASKDDLLSSQYL